MMDLQIVPQSLLDMSKKDIQNVAKMTVSDELMSFDPMKYLLWSKKAEEFFKVMQETLKPDALRVAEKYPEKVLNQYGAKFEKTAVHTEYDFTNCNDQELKELTAQYEQVMSKLQARKDFLKNLREPMTILNEETGEVIKIHPAVKKTTDGLKITY